jgi:hypothetical protein
VRIRVAHGVRESRDHGYHRDSHYQPKKTSSPNGAHFQGPFERLGDHTLSI